MTQWRARLTELVLASPEPEHAISYWAALLGGRGEADRVAFGDGTAVKVTEGAICGLVEVVVEAGPEMVEALAARGAARQDDSSLVLIDPDSWRLRALPVEEVRPMQVRSATVSHVTLASTDPARQRDHYEQIGFMLSEALADVFFWMRPNPVHHSVAFVRAKATGINHLAVELADAGALIAAVDRVVAQGETIEFGPGRHLIGGNLFAYVVDRYGLRWELCAELERRAEDAVPEVHPLEVRARSINLFGPRPPASFLELAGGPGPVAASS